MLDPGGLVPRGRFALGLPVFAVPDYDDVAAATGSAVFLVLLAAAVIGYLLVRRRRK